MNKKLVLLGSLIAILYFLPAFIQAEFDAGNHIKHIGLAFPRVVSGDEPAYLTAISSFVKERDFDLGDNYDRSRFQGACESGYNFRNRIIARHVRYFYNNGEYSEFFLLPNRRFNPKFYNYDLSIFQQFPFHPIGLPLLLSFFLWPSGNSCLLESAALFFSIFTSLVGLLFLYRTLIYYRHNTNAAVLITILTGFGTTLWFYSKTLFVEPYITTLLLISYYLFVVRKHIVLPAIFLGIGSLMKYPFALFPITFCLYLLLTKRFAKMLIFGVISSIFAFSLLLINYSLYGAPFSQGYGYGDIFEGLVGIFVSAKHSIFIFAPFLAFVFLGIKRFYQDYKNEALLTLALILSYYLFISSFVGWWGGGFANRNMTTILPFLGIITYFWYINNQNKQLKYLFYLLGILAIIINFQTAFFHFAFWGDKPPWQLISLLFTKLPRILEVFLG